MSEEIIYAVILFLVGVAGLTGSERETDDKKFDPYLIKISILSVSICCILASVYLILKMVF